MDSNDRVENAKSTGGAIPKRKYKNVVGEVYKKIIDTVLEAVREEFFVAGSDAQTMKILRDLWYDKIRASKAVDSLLQPELWRSGALSAAERAEAVARRDVEVANERMVCSSSLDMLTDAQPSTSQPVIPSGVAIDPTLVKNVPALPAAGADQVSIGPLVNNFDMRPEWSFPQEALRAPQTRLVWVTLKLPVRNSNGAVQVRKLYVRVLAEFLQKQSLFMLLNADLLNILASMPSNAASGVLQRHLNMLMMCDEPDTNRVRLAQQLDGGGGGDDDDDDSDDCFYNYNQPVTLNRLLQQQHDYTSSSDDEEQAEAGGRKQTGSRPKRLNKRAKSKLKKLFHLCSSSSTSSSNESEQTAAGGQHADAQPLAKQTNQLFESLASVEQEGAGCAAAMPADVDKRDEAAESSMDAGDELLKAWQQDSKEPPLNTDDDMSSLESNEETDNICICLFDTVKHARSKWRMNLRSGIMNINGADYIFNGANVSSIW